jgi:outer membrane receptor protein involved in Fe transport
VVTADYIEGSIASELSLQRESTQVISVIGAEQISRTGDSDAAEALQRVSGLTLEQGKYVVVRGQPFRYTLTQFNGLPLPSPDPIIQVTPLDLFPETILANIQVQKSYSVDKPGDFGAGLIGLYTRSVPDEDFLEVKVSTGGNSISTGEDGVRYDGSEDDYLGTDAGDRALPGSIPSQPNGLGALGTADRQAIGRSFPDIVLFEDRDNMPPDVGLEAVGGKSFPTEYGTFGVVATGSYSHKFRNEEELERTFVSPADVNPRVEFSEFRTDREVQISSLLGLSGQWDNHSVTSNTFFIRDSQDRAQFSEGFARISGNREEQRYLLEFQEREMWLTQLLGEHEFELASLNWRAQTAGTERDRPDRRDYSYQRTFGSDVPFRFSTADNYERQFNTVDEDIDALAFDVDVPLNPHLGLAEEQAELSVKVGYDMAERDRESETRRFLFEPQEGRVDLTLPNVEQIINDGTIDPDGDIVRFSETTLGTDIYEGTADTDGYFLEGDARIGEWLQVVAGLRRTNAEYEVLTRNGDVGGFDTSFTLPAISVTGFISPSMQVRAAYGETVSYPRLVELSATTFFNPDTGESFVGNPDLLPTEIKSYDLRWEWYPTALETLSAGLFYKDLTNTIEQQFVIEGGGGIQNTFVNGETGEITGLEVGARLSMDRLYDFGVPRDGLWGLLGNAYVQADIAISDSEVELPQGTGAATNLERELTGQADRVLNLQLGYDGATHDFTLLINHVGERLDGGGVDGLPDIYQEPTTFVDLTYSLTIPDILPVIGDVPFIGEGQLKLKGRNLLNEENEYFQGDLLQRRTLFGRGYSASLKWDFQ